MGNSVPHQCRPCPIQGPKRATVVAGFFADRFNCYVDERDLAKGSLRHSVIRYNEIMLDPPGTRRRWFQFRLRTLLVMTVLTGTGLTAIRIPLQRARAQQHAVKAILNMGGTIDYSDQYSWPEWLRISLGDELGKNVSAVYLADKTLAEADLMHVQAFPQLTSLNLDRTHITDAAMLHLEGLTQLRELSLAEAQITNAGMVSLRTMKRLEVLNLFFTQVGDNGLASLQGMSRLRSLTLRATPITDAGLVHLRGLPDLQSLDLSRTQITDAGLIHLGQISQLFWLELNNTHITPSYSPTAF
jgi:Leucine-rich repeat (LRR) protein